MSDVAPPQPGWYADPENPAGERWWNGSGWSDQKRDSAPTPAPAPAPVAGFSYGSTAVDSRPDPYAAPPVYTPSPYVAAPYGAPAYGQGSNGLAIAGLIVSAGGWIILGVFASIAGIILSAFGLARARQREAAGNPNTGRGIAMAGLVIGIVVTVLSILIVGAYIALFLAIPDTY
ncbi:MAG TPA: DUF4190 domain-containing protein [Pseudolysinimonas sp.]|nr:DUF4190 domain-containing protein [Pseudolysinimonas sp.]